MRAFHACMFALHVLSVSALLVLTDYCFHRAVVCTRPTLSLPTARGNTACAQAVVLARLLGLMHACLHAYVVAYVCFYPFAVEKVSLAASLRCAT